MEHVKSNKEHGRRDNHFLVEEEEEGGAGTHTYGLNGISRSISRCSVHLTSIVNG